MLRQRYNEIARKRWYDLLILAAITLTCGIVRIVIHSSIPEVATVSLPTENLLLLFSGFALVLPVYWIVNELTHRHRQAFASAAALASMWGISILGGQDQHQVWAYALLLGSCYFALRGLRRYGPQWKDMLTSGLLFGLGIVVGGIWPAYNVVLPFTVVAAIALRPIVHYKAWSLPAAVLLALAVILLPFGTHFDEFLMQWREELALWNDPMPGDSPFFSRLGELSFLGASRIWFFFGLLSAGYGLHSQRMHGDLAALVGSWWLVMALVLAMLRPCFDVSVMLAFLVPLSCCIGPYLNLLGVSRRIRRADRRAYRTTLGLTAACFLLSSVAFLLFRDNGLPPVGTCVVALLFAVATVWLIVRHYRQHSVQQRLTLYMLVAAGWLEALCAAL